MVQHCQASWVKIRFALKTGETPKMEDVYIGLKGNLIIFADSTISITEKNPITKTKNPEIMTLIFSAGFCYKRKKRKRQSPYGLLTRPKAVTPTETKTTFKPYLRKSSYNIRREHE